MPKNADDKNLKFLRKLIDEYPSEAADILLDTPFWHSSIGSQQAYRRESDDTDGKKMGIAVAFGQDSDAWFEVSDFNTERGNPQPPILHRFRSYFGGGNSLRVRTALIVLARAIMLDNEQKPDRP